MKGLDKIQNLGASLLQSGYPFPVYSLFTWSPDREASLGRLVRAFKGGRAVAFAEEMVARMAFERRISGEFNQPVVVVPPRDRRQKMDHAGLLGVLLAETLGSSLLDVFEGDSRKDLGAQAKQKTKTVEERAQKKFDLKSPLGVEDNQSCPADLNQQVVFVDDVITSGATARAAYRALGEPRRFEVWTLVHRPKLAASRRF